MPSFVKGLFGGSIKTLGTSLTISGSQTVSAGNLIAVGTCWDFGSDTFSCTDNLGNTYTNQKQDWWVSGIAVVLFTAPVTTGGTLTSITISGRISVTAKSAYAAEFDGQPSTTFITSGSTAPGVWQARYDSNYGTPSYTSGFLVGLGGIESATPLATGPDGTIGTASTTGQGDSSNVSTTLSYRSSPAMYFWLNGPTPQNDARSVAVLLVDTPNPFPYTNGSYYGG